MDEPSKPNIVHYTPELLNRSEWFELQFITDGDPGTPEIDTRFAGQSGPMINSRDRRQRQALRSDWVTLGLQMFVMALVVVFFLFYLPSLRTAGQVF